jgi:hypothetical protein
MAFKDALLSARLTLCVGRIFWPRPFVPSSMGATSTVSGVCDVTGENGGDSLRTVELGSDGLLLPLTELSGRAT